MMGLTPFLDYVVVNLSGEWKKKTAIICAIIHRPKIIFLDEPTAGLDIQSRHLLWDVIHAMNRAGTTIFLTTHYIEEAEALCDRVGIINGSNLISLGTPSELCGNLGRMAVDYNGVHGRSTSYFSSREDAKKFAETLPEEENPVVRKTNLEDVFLEKTGRCILEIS